MISRPQRLLPIAAIALALATTLGATRAQAQTNIISISQYREWMRVQTGDDATLMDNSYSFQTGLVSASLDFYDTVTMTPPAPGSLVGLTKDTPTLWNYSTSFGDKPSLDDAFPLGTYLYEATNSSGTDTIAFDTGPEAYAFSSPYLTGSDFTNLQGMDATQAFQFHFSTFVPNPSNPVTVNSDIYFYIYDLTTQTVVADFATNDLSTTGYLLAANTLQAGHDYWYGLSFNSWSSASTGGTALYSTFSTRVVGNFSTAAVPEPASALLLAMGLTAGCTAYRMRRGK